MIAVPNLTSSGRRLVKMEKPRPLKITSQNYGDQSMDSVLSEMDLVSQKLNSTNYDRSVYGLIASLCENLKMFGHQLESVYKDQLDRCYVSLRNGCRDDRLSLASRYRLLEVIELRAMHWQPNENLISYYKQKLAQIEAEENTIEEHGQPTPQQQPLDISGYISAAETMQLTPPVSAKTPLFGGQSYMYPQTGAVLYGTPQQQQHTPTPSVMSPTGIPMGPPGSAGTPTAVVSLGPGEIIKNSGKFTKPMRIPGKNYCKDEVVIRNADSGKVMGLKGRRVHMIEELSETIISFQRVAPGARERLVQITGPNEENINHAKQLIEETIRRNASPVRSEDRDSIYNSLGGSSSSISSHTSDELMQGTKRTGLMSTASSLVDEVLSEYRYTVVHENEAIRITGTNLDLVRTAKIVLDEFFNGEPTNLNNLALSLSNCDSSSTTSSVFTNRVSPPPKSTRGSPPLKSASVSSSSSSSRKSLSPPPRSLRGKSPGISSTPTSVSSSTGAREKSPPGEDIPNTSSKVSTTGVTVVRQPLIPSAPKEVIDSVEMEANGKTSKGRRLLFAKTSEERQQTEDPEAGGSVQTYSREFILECAAFPLSRKTPPNWSEVVKQTPLLIKKNFHHLSGLVAIMSEKGTEAVNAMPSFLQECDLVNPKNVKLMSQRWSLDRTPSVVEEEDSNNGNY